jgi:hypothetical protein
MANYQAIIELVDQTPADTWEMLREIKQRRPAAAALRVVWDRNYERFETPSSAID